MDARRRAFPSTRYPFQQSLGGVVGEHHVNQTCQLVCGSGHGFREVNQRATLITSQLPVTHWHEYLGEPTCGQCGTGPTAAKCPPTGAQAGLPAPSR